MDYPVLAGCGLTRSDVAKVLPPVLLVCQRGCKWSANLLQEKLDNIIDDARKFDQSYYETRTWDTVMNWKPKEMKQQN